MSNENKRIYLVRSTNEDNNAFVGVRISNDSIRRFAGKEIKWDFLVLFDKQS